MPRPAINLKDKSFGSLTVLQRTENKGLQVAWLCECLCGGTSVVRTADLMRGATTSCGCIQKATWERISKQQKHGLTRTREYRSWESAKQRCFNPNSHGYHNYGGRGITMCDEWANNFSLFLEHMGSRPEGFTLDRINPDGNYEPGNCRWADLYTQNGNRRKTCLSQEHSNLIK